MLAHPIQLHVERPAQLSRVHVLIRLALLAALGAIGCSSVYWIAYLALPAIAAMAISQGGGESFLRDAASRVTPALRWLAAAYAYLWLLTDELPGSEEAAQLTLETSGQPTMRSALLRLVTSLPALVLLVVLSMAAGLLWCLAALFILVRGRAPAPLVDFFALTLRYQFRLIAYHLSLVDRYPSTEEGAVERPIAQQHA